MEDKREESNEDVRYYLEREQHDHIQYSLPMTCRDKWKTQLTEEQYALCADWILGQAARFQLRQITIILAVEIFNRFVFSISLAQNKIPLAAAASLMIASKVEEVFVPIRAIDLCGTEMSLGDLCGMERLLLDTLGFSLPRATFAYFVAHYEKLYAGKLFRRRLAFVTQRLLTTRKYIGHLPSVLARVAVNAALGAPDIELVALMCCSNRCEFLETHFNDILSDGSYFASTFGR